MKKEIIFIPAAALLLMTSCVSSDYEKGYDAGYAEGVKAYSDGYDKGYAEGLKKTSEIVTVYGDFTATVREILPDYEAGGNTDSAAVITLFQGSPSVIRLNEAICNSIQVGETYTFEIGEEDAMIPSYQLSDDNSVASDIDFGRLYIKSCRTPSEDEYGLSCWRVRYKQSFSEDASDFNS